MSRVTGVWLLVLLIASSGRVWSQTADDDVPAPDNEVETQVAAEETEPEVEPEVLETDDESYLDIDDKDFKPSEEIPTDQSIPFPTDI
tara:strand:- start:162 stop:425 length:264 start_codon:yes stop_codon:yes gene_type:complete